MINPLKVLICTPCHDGRVEMGYAGAMLQIGAAHMVGNIALLQSVSLVGLARALMVHGFRRSAFEWMVFIDSDMYFTSEDFRILMDYPARVENGELVEQPENNPEGTTLTEDGHALIVCAEYARKVDTLDPARFGLGFCRIHRSVFDVLESSDDSEGQPRVGQFKHKGDLISDFFPTGAGFDNTYFGEDTGFFHLCRLCGIVPRVEQRTRLMHVGRKAYSYKPSSVIEG